MEAEPGAPRVAGCRSTSLPGGRRLEIRPVEDGDLDGPVELFARLSLDDRHRRFFSVYEPSREIVEHYVETAAGGRGCVLVACEHNAREEVVGEASYFLQPDGSGELAITVAPDRRGWLGAYLLDALVEAATAAGVPRLEADILLENRPMWALVRRRGFVHIAGPDTGITRVAISAAEPLGPDAQRDPARAERYSTQPSRLASRG